MVDWENAQMALPGYNVAPHASDGELIEVLNLIQGSKRPMLYTGGGIVTGGAHEELRAFAEMTGIPVAYTLMGIGGFPDDHPQSLRWFGMHGMVAGNWAVNECDLLIAMGARFDDRITGAVKKFAPRRHNRPRRHRPERAPQETRSSSTRSTVRSSSPSGAWSNGEGARLREARPVRVDQESLRLARGVPVQYDESRFIQSQRPLTVLWQETKGEAIVCTGVGQHQMWSAQFYKFKQPRQFISSLGLGTMGFGLPAALGAKVANPDKLVVDIDGDGSFTMNVQELATAVRENIPVKIMLLDNQHLGMVMQWEDILYDGVRGQTILCDPKNIGGPENPLGLYPDWVKICEGFGVPARRVIRKEELRDAIRE
jgi:acetolactate synthase-1/2/3 large subunit